MSRRAPLSVCMILAAVAALACGGPKDDPILSLSAEESLVAGQELMAKEKYAQAREYLTHAFEVEPNSRSGREALLLAADTLYLEGGSSNYIKAEAKYRDFQNRFPTSERSDYVQLQIANSLLQRMEPPDRDQSTTRSALEAFEDLVALFPTSEHAAGARAQIAEARANLAEHEFLVGYFYLRFRLPTAAVDRLDTLLEVYPEYPARDKALYWLGVAYQRSKQPDKATATVERLRDEHPQSEFIAELPKLEARIRGTKAGAEPAPSAPAAAAAEGA